MTRKLGFRGYGQTEKAILAFLNQKALECPSSDSDGEAYTSVTEIAQAIGKSTHNIVLAMQQLRNGGLVRIFPSKRRRPLFYGSTILPEPDIEALNKARIEFGLDPI